MDTKYVTVQANGIELEGLGVNQFADACREVGLSFLEGAANGWGKRELAAWLVGPYRALTARASADDSPPSAMDSGVLRAGAIEELVDLVRIAVSSTLAELQAGDTLAITHSIRERRVSWANSEGGLVWVPVDHPRMRLEARVMSLFAVDYLLRPEPYTTDLSVCSACDLVSFDGAGRSCQRCGDRSRPSHVRGTDSAPGIIKPIKTAG